MRQRPFAFIRLADRWVNMAMVTDIEDHGDEIRIFLASDMARIAGHASDPIDVARRFVLKEAADIDKLRKWMLLNDED